MVAVVGISLGHASVMLLDHRDDLICDRRVATLPCFNQLICFSWHGMWHGIHGICDKTC